MPFQLLARLKATELPAEFTDTEDIDKVLLLCSLGLIEARIPPSMTQGSSWVYTAPAVVLALTPRGVSAVEERALK